MSRREEFIQGMRDLASWFEDNPEIPIPSYRQVVIENWVWGGENDEDGESAKQELLRLMGAGEGPWVKDYTGSYLEVRREFGPCRYVLTVNREEVCTKRVVGTKTVKRRDPALVEQVPIIDVEEDVVEWDCHPLLAPTED
jgi:hypothetical protein